MSKDFWDMAQALGSVLMPISVAVVGIVGSNYLATKEAEDTKARFYAELISKREEADSLLRKDMFNTVIKAFLEPKSADPSQDVLSLELLASNFHESLDLRSIFKNVYTQISKLPHSRRQPLIDRLWRVAGEVKDKQILALTGAGGQKLDANPLDLETLEKEAKPTKMIDGVVDLPLDEGWNSKTTKARVLLWANAVDEKSKEIRVRMEILTEGATFADNVFWVGPFDLPMLDNTRLKNGQRCAIILTKFEARTSAEVTLVIFPSSRASLKDKPYVDEMLTNVVAKKTLNFR